MLRLLGDKIFQQKFSGMSTARCKLIWLFKDDICGLHRINANYISLSHLNRIELVLFYAILCCIECFDLSSSIHVQLRFYTVHYEMSLGNSYTRLHPTRRTTRYTQYLLFSRVDLAQ